MRNIRQFSTAGTLPAERNSARRDCLRKPGGDSRRRCGVRNRGGRQDCRSGHMDQHGRPGRALMGAALAFAPEEDKATWPGVTGQSLSSRGPDGSPCQRLHRHPEADEDIAAGRRTSPEPAKARSPPRGARRSGSRRSAVLSAGLHVSRLGARAGWLIGAWRLRRWRGLVLPDLGRARTARRRPAG